MLRITGGELRGRRIATPKGTATRPTSEKVREAIFSALDRWVALEGAVVADLFAGSGALGIEALSRGAARVEFVESHRPTAAAIRATLHGLGVDEARWRVTAARCARWLEGLGGAAEPPGVVLGDPPYASPDGPALLEGLGRATELPAGAVIVWESAAKSGPAAPSAGLVLLRVKSYGDTRIQYLARRDGPPGPDPDGDAP